MDNRINKQEVLSQMELNQTQVRSTSGFTLLESMIALVIFSIALLALAGMYAKTLSLSHSTYLRALASIQAMDLEERIRANPNASDYAFTCDGDEAAIDPDSFNGGADSIKASDQQDWCANTYAVFGGAAQVVSVSPDGTDDLIISVQWSERSIDEDNEVEVAQSTFEYTVRK
jgi:type IV pilus assembly protein PilV